MPDRTEVRWREPHREKVRGLVLRYRALGILKPSFFAWVVLLPSLIAAILIGAMLWLYPGTQVPWRPVVLTVLWLPLYTLLMLAVYSIAPRTAYVRPEHISICHGQSWIDIKPSQLVGATIATDVTPAVLRITFMSRKDFRRPSRQRDAEVAIHPKVDLAQLIDVLTQFRAAATPPGSRTGVAPSYHATFNTPAGTIT